MTPSKIDTPRQRVVFSMGHALQGVTSSSEPVRHHRLTKGRGRTWPLPVGFAFHLRHLDFLNCCGPLGPRRLWRGATRGVPGVAGSGDLLSGSTNGYVAA